MKPIGPLMIEHRLIERMIKLMKQASERLAAGSQLGEGFIPTAVDFFRNYADRTHHGKEEDILFHDLAAKDLSAPDRDRMRELIEDHARARVLVGNLDAAGRSWRESGDPETLATMRSTIDEITALYPGHIEKEDKKFFPAAMEYLDEGEQSRMLENFARFDREMIHEKYIKAVEDQERNNPEA